MGYAKTFLNNPAYSYYRDKPIELEGDTMTSQGKGFDARKELASVRDMANRMFEDAVAYAKGSSYSVPVDIYETDTHIVIVAGPLYKVKADTLDISIQNDMLTLLGETEPEAEVPTEAYLKRERRAGHFKRTLKIPVEVNADGTKAQLKNDILKILLPKI